MEWISVHKSEAPKDRKFLFYYYCGMGLGFWTRAYTITNGHSFQSRSAYFLVLWPGDESEIETFEWSEEKMKEMDVLWRDLPDKPNE